MKPALSSRCGALPSPLAFEAVGAALSRVCCAAAVPVPAVSATPLAVLAATVYPSATASAKRERRQRAAVTVSVPGGAAASGSARKELA